MIKDLAEKLKDFRKQYGFSQKQVATKIGVSPSIVSAYETGERTPSTEVLLALSFLYHCSTDYLLGKQPLNDETSGLDVRDLNAKQIEALKNLIRVMK